MAPQSTPALLRIAALAKVSLAFAKPASVLLYAAELTFAAGLPTAP